ncbi:hypothetical protein [Streptomyces halobius]|uniref:Uncharacterized protein n=1 Tax=Streptomyces halobius TaxID=2879846 RepID=A0ABY4MGP0_9ACTN|nr:hypothetical protein [Streptomyces halobius]UQA96966.1 hypothetical protein K9S39_38415 [Streptomyces halobius]
MNGRRAVPATRLRRVPLIALTVFLAFLLGGAATTPDALPAAALKTSGGPPPVSAFHDADEEDHKKSNEKREGKRGQLRRAARSTLGAPQLIGRRLPPERDDLPPGSAPPSPGPAAAASRPLQLPLLHCVFRC